MMQNKPLLIIFLFLFIVLVIVQVDSKLIASYNLAKKYEWNITDVRPTQEIMFIDSTNFNKSIQEKNNIVIYSVDNPFDMSAVLCSDEAGLSYDQFLNKKILIYSLVVKNNINISNEENQVNPHMDLSVGFYNNTIVFAALFVNETDTATGYYPINFSEDEIKEEILKTYHNQPYYIPIYGDARISFLPGGYQLFHYPTCVFIPQTGINPETIIPTISAEIVKITFDSRYILALQNELEANTNGDRGNKKPLEPIRETYYIVDTADGVIYKYDSLFEFNNQRYKLRISDNLAWQDVNSFSIMSYGRFKNNF